jgi:hypothetical protein
MQAINYKRTAIAACGVALCGALAVPAAIEVAATVTDSGQTQIESDRKKPKKEKKAPKPKHIETEALDVAPGSVNLLT